MIGFVHFFVVMLLTLTIYANLKQLSPNYARAAADLGASRVQTFIHVIGPLTVPGVVVGAFITFVLCIGDYVTAADPGRQQRACPAADHHAADRPPRGLSGRLGAGHHPDAGGHRRVRRVRALAAPGARMRIGPAGVSWLGGLYAALLYGFIFLPVAVLVLFSFQGGRFPIPPFNGPSLKWYEAVLADDRLVQALVNSARGRLPVLRRRLRARISRRLRIRPLPVAGKRPAACADHGAAGRELPHHRDGPADHVQHDGGPPLAADGGHRPCGDQYAALLRDHLQPDGRPPGQRRARPRATSVQATGR